MQGQSDDEADNSTSTPEAPDRTRSSVAFGEGTFIRRAIQTAPPVDRADSRPASETDGFVPHIEANQDVTVTASALRTRMRIYNEHIEGVIARLQWYYLQRPLAAWDTPVQA